MNISVIVGSCSGSAESGATYLKTHLEELGHTIVVHSKPTLEDVAHCKCDAVIIVTATAGNGDMPNNLRTFWRKLSSKKTSLHHIRYAVAALGDSSYGENFCLAGKSLHTMFLDKGASPLSEPLFIDSVHTPNPEQVIVPWTHNLLQ